MNMSIRFPIELHLVHFKSSYGSLGEAVKQRDGLAVLGVMFELAEEDNPVLTPLVDAMTNIVQAGKIFNYFRGYKLFPE